MTRRWTRRKSEPASGESPSSGMLRAGFPHFTASLVRPVSKVFIASLHHGQPMLRVHQLCNASSSSTWASIAWWCNFWYHFEHKIYIMKVTPHEFFSCALYLFIFDNSYPRHSCALLIQLTRQPKQSASLSSPGTIQQGSRSQCYSITGSLPVWL